MTAEAISLYENKLICSAMEMNAVYSIDLETSEVTFLDSIPEEGLFEKRLVGSIESYHENLIFIPYNAKKIWKYNMDTKEWKAIQIENESVRGKFWNSFLYNNYLYMIPTRYPGIVKINLEVDKVEEYIDCIMPVGREKAEYGYFFSDFVIDEEELVLASCSSNFILRYNLVNGAYSWKELGSTENKYVGIAKVGMDYWLAPRRDTNIVRLSSDGKVTEYKLPDGFSDAYNFLGIEYDKEIFLYSINEGSTIKINPLNGNMSVINNSSGYTFSRWLTEYIHVEAYYDGSVLIKDTKSGKKEKILIKKEDVDSFVIMKIKEDNSLLKQNFFSETEICDLTTFMRLV